MDSSECSDVVMLLKRVVRWMRLYRSYLPGSLQLRGLGEEGSEKSESTKKSNASSSEKKMKRREWKAKLNSSYASSASSEEETGHLPSTTRPVSIGLSSSNEEEDESTDSTDGSETTDEMTEEDETFSDVFSLQTDYVNDDVIPSTIQKLRNRRRAKQFLQSGTISFLSIRSSSRDLLPRIRDDNDEEFLLVDEERRSSKGLYLEIMSVLIQIIHEMVTRTNGEVLSIDNFDGKITAAWGVVTPCVEHVLAAANAAQGIKARLLSDERIRNRTLRFEIIVSSGRARFGHVGCETFRRLVVMGSAVTRNDSIYSSRPSSFATTNKLVMLERSSSSSSLSSSSPLLQVTILVDSLVQSTLKYTHQMIPCSLMTQCEDSNPHPSIVYELGTRFFDDQSHQGDQEWLYTIPRRALEDSKASGDDEDWVEVLEQCWRELAGGKVERARTMIQERYPEVFLFGFGRDEEKRGLLSMLGLL